MKNTSILNVLGDSSMQDDTVVIHPNDGFDLGMMMLHYPINLYINSSISDFKSKNNEKMSGKVILKNECRMGNVELGMKLWSRMGKPKKVQIYYIEPDLLLWVPPPKEE